MTRCLIIVLSLCWSVPWAVASDGPAATAGTTAASRAADLLVVVGASGAEQFQTPFREAAQRWQNVGSAANATVQTIGRPDADGTEKTPDAENDYEQLRAAVDRSNITTEQPLWIVLIGHGTFAGEVAKFNLTGPDFSARELSEWLEGYRRPIILINGSSASGPFINRLSAPERVIVTATRSGGEQNYARFGEYFSKAIGDLDADLDHDDAVSVLEAFLHAAGAVQRFYEAEGRLATEHPLLDDNADGLGTPADFFRGVRAVKSPGGDAEVDGDLARRHSLLVRHDVAPLTATQQKQRDRLEQQLRTLRDQKDALGEALYFEKFNALAVQLAELYRDAEAPRPNQKEPQADEIAPADENGASVRNGDS